METVYIFSLALLCGAFVISSILDHKHYREVNAVNLYLINRLMDEQRELVEAITEAIEITAQAECQMEMAMPMPAPSGPILVVDLPNDGAVAAGVSGGSGGGRVATKKGNDFQAMADKRKVVDGNG